MIQLFFLNAINGIFTRFGKPTLPLDVLKKRFGQPWTRIYRQAGISEAMASKKRLYEIYNELYLSQPPALPFSDLKPTLEWLRDKNIILAVVSTQQNNITLPLFRYYALDSFFSHFEDAVSNKTRALRKIFNLFEVKPEGAAYIGDQEGDIIHAKKAGCASIGFDRGLYSVERLMRAWPDFLIHHYSEMKKLPIFD